MEGGKIVGGVAKMINGGEEDPSQQQGDETMVPKAMVATVATEDRNGNGEGGLDSDSEGEWRQRWRRGVETTMVKGGGDDDGKVGPGQRWRRDSWGGNDDDDDSDDEIVEASTTM